MSAERKTGGSNDYYSADVTETLDGRPAYTVQCLEVIETLGMTFAEGEAFKAIWRSCAARTLGKHKADNNALYDAEKVEFYGKRMVAAAKLVVEEEKGPRPLPTKLPGPWTEHAGTGAPVEGGTRVEVEYLNGQTGRCEARYAAWGAVKQYRLA